MIDTEKSIEELISEINKSVDDLRKKPITIDKSDIPSNIELIIPGIKNVSSITSLFSKDLDKTILNILDNIMSGNVDDALKALDSIKNMFEKSGLGEGSFSGPVSKTIINTVINSINSPEYVNMKSGVIKSLSYVRRINLVMKRLKKQTGVFGDKETRKKYKDTLYAIKRTIRIVAKIYKNRKIINDRVLSGLKNIVTEDVESIEYIERIE